jgi:hypothetical protein
MTSLREAHAQWKAEQEAKARAMASEANPCIRQFGKGPEGKTCATCKRIYVRRLAKNYWKCSLRPDTRGGGSDHRLSWAACSKWEEIGK